MKRYYSTRDVEHKAFYSLKEAAFMGVAPDGGLFIAESSPEVDLAEVQRLASISYADIAIYMA